MVLIVPFHFLMYSREESLLFCYHFTFLALRKEILVLYHAGKRFESLFFSSHSLEVAHWN